MLKSALTILAVAGSGLFAQSTEPVATVDGQAIERQSFDHWMSIAAKSTGQANAAVPDREAGYANCIAAKRKALPPKDRRKASDTKLRRQCEQEYTQLRDQVLQLLISFKWIDGEAAARGITVSDAEVARSFAKQKRQSFPKESDYREFIETSGQTEADILLRVRLDLLSNKLRDVVVGTPRISDEDVEAYYAANRKRFVVPERRAFRYVLTKRKTQAAAARAALEGGATWKAIAKQYSIDTESGRKGGQVSATAEDDMDSRLAKAVFRARKGQLVGPVRTTYGSAVFTVTKVVPERRQRFEEVRKLIKQTLASEAGQQALDVFVQDFTARWKAKTECAEGFVTSDCRNAPPPAERNWDG